MIVNPSGFCSLDSLLVGTLPRSSRSEGKKGVGINFLRSGRIELALNSFKLLIVDIDGTLVGKEGTVSDEDREALGRVGDSGIKISLGTGRAFQSCSEVLDVLSLDGYHVFCDGALVYSPTHQNEVYVEALDKAVVKRAIEFARQNEMNLDLYSTTRYFVEQETWSAVVHRDYFGIPPTIADFNTLCEEERIIKAGLADPPYRCSFVMGVLGGIPATVRNLAMLVDDLPENSDWQAIGIGKHQMTLGATAVAMGGGMRVGFEDNIYAKRGVLAKSNAELVERAVAIVEAMGREVATVAEAREKLGLGGR